MKKTLILIIAVTLVIAAAMTLSSCEQWADPYEKLDKEGNTVSVKYDAGEGVFVGRNGVTLVDVFSYDDVNYGGVKLLSPDDTARGEGNAYTVSCSNHILGGWYIATTDGDGNTVPDLSKPWDFSKDKLDSSYLTSGTLSSSSPVLTLCAYWIPYTNFEIYAPDGNGGFELLDTVQLDKIRLPLWDNGKIDMKDFPEINGMTFEGAYLDSALEKQITSASYEIEVSDGDDNPTVRIYTTWKEGEWYRISTAEQLYKYAKVNGCYLIENDISFENKTWSGVFGNNFNGKFVSAEGGCYTISGITSANSTSATTGAVFGNVGADAEFRNVSFADVTYTVNGSAKVNANNRATFALFAAKVADGAVFENVSVSGSLIFTNDIADGLRGYVQYYDIGIESAAGDVAGITCSASYGFADPDTVANGAVIVLNDDGTVSIVFPA